MNKFQTLTVYINYLRSADWDYEFSDDHNYWKSARDMMASLYGASNLSKKHQEAWKAFSDCSRHEITREARDAIANELLETENV